MPAARKIQMRRPIAQSVKFPGANPPPQNPSLSDIMNAISQIQQNQAQIMTMLNAIRTNQSVWGWTQVTCALDLADAQSINLGNQIVNDIGSYINQLTS